MSKRKKGGEEAKELGGAQKLRLKRKKMLEQDAAKCAKLTDLFRGKKPRLTATPLSARPMVRREQDTAA